MFDFAHCKSFSRKGVMSFAEVGNRENDGKCAGTERCNHRDNCAD